MAGKVFLETEKSSEEEVDETRIQRKKERETWEEAVSRETKAKQDHEAITYSPGRMDALIKKAVLFQESHSKVIRSLRAPVVLFMTFLGFSAHGVNLLITFHADIFYAVGFIVSTTSIVAKWFPVYFEDGIRDGNNLGVGLRIFRLLDSKDASSIGNNMSTGSALSIFVLCVGVILQIVYFVMIWNTMPIWGRAVFLAGQLMISFVPASCLTALTFLFFQTCDGCSLLIRKQQVFVFEDANIVGGVDWDRTQRNFDILERFIEDLNSGWYSYFFVTEFFLPLGCVLMILGVVNNSLSWAQADHSPPATLVLLLSESCYTAAFLLYIVLIWVSASEVTAACDEVVRQTRDMMAYLRKHPSFKASSDEYNRAKLFYEYVQETRLGFKGNNIVISYSLGMTIIYPAIAAVFVVILPVCIPMTYSYTSIMGVR